MKAYLTRRYRFSASHRLHSEAYSDAENQAMYGKCNNPYGHGHNYIAEVTVSGQVDTKTGMVCNLTEIDEFAQKAILGRFDHTNLNLHECFEKRVPTTENLCIEIYDSFRGFSGAHLERVRVEETSNNSFEYSGS